MAYVLAEHKIGRWSEFENIFRGDGERRKILGSKSAKVFRKADAPDEIFVLFEWDSVEGAKKFAGGLETHEAMNWATSGIWSRVTVMEEVFELEA